MSNKGGVSSDLAFGKGGVFNLKIAYTGQLKRLHYSASGIVKILDSPLCGRRDFVPAGTTRKDGARLGRLAIALLETFASPFLVIGRNPALAGRGGSVSRRDHNLARKEPRPTNRGI